MTAITGVALVIVHPSAGNTIEMELPANKAPAVVNDTVDVDVKLVVPTVGCHSNSPDKAPAVIALTTIGWGPSMTPTSTALVVTTAVAAARTADGVVTPATVNCTSVYSGMSEPLVVMTSVRVV